MVGLFTRWLLVLLLWPTTLSLAVDAPVILVFGDSLSAGYGLPQGKGWANLLQQRLREQGYEYRVVNASISGETTLGGRNRLAQALAEHRPRIVIIELGPNDALRGQPLDAMRDNLTQMVHASQTAKAKVVLVGMRIPPNYGPDYTEKFHASFAAVAKATHAALVPFLFDGFAERREMFQSDGLHPAIEAQSLMLDNVWKPLKPLLHKPAQKG
ncbi:MAG TPA: arylesterase [Burkholderiales bacterium]|nr:arylesterase [Burkholderiales bacterium]